MGKPIKDLVAAYVIPNSKLIFKAECNTIHHGINLDIVDPLTFNIPAGDSIGDLIQHTVRPTIRGRQISVEVYSIRVILDMITGSIVRATEHAPVKSYPNLYNWYRRYGSQIHCTEVFEKLMIDVYRFGYKPGGYMDGSRAEQLFALLEAVKNKMMAEHGWSDDTPQKYMRYSRRRRR